MNKIINKKIIISLLIIFMIYLLPSSIINVNAEENNSKIKYTTHVQYIGWQKEKSDGEVAGTSGMSLRLEGLKVKLNNQEYTGDIEYRTHVQYQGWKSYVKNGEMSGTTGLGFRLEGVQIRLTGEMAEHYDVYYRVHAENFGWMNWAKNDEMAGTEGYGFRLEAIEIVLVDKGEEPPIRANTNSQRAFRKLNDDKLVSYTTHVQYIGWQKEVYDGAMAGTSGMSLRLEGLKVKLMNQKYPGDIEYNTHVQYQGWKPFVKNGEMSGTSGLGLRLEAAQIRLTGEMAEHYDIYYRVHAENFGWMNWAKNGEKAGTEGYGFRLEGIEIVLVEKNTVFSGETVNHFRQNKDGYCIIDDKNIVITDYDYIVKKERDLINQIKGYYLYLDGHDAYMKINEIEWYDHHSLDVIPYRMEYYKGKIVAFGDDDYNTYLNDSSPQTEILRNLLLENPSETGTKLVTKYDMHINNNKLYMKLNGNTYTFTKSLTQKPVLLSLKTSNLTINRGETIKLNLNVDYYHSNHKISYTSSNPDIASCSGREITNDGHIEISCVGKKVGNTKITIKDLEGGNYVEFNIRVNYVAIHPNEIKIYDEQLNNVTSLDLIKDDSMKLKAVVFPTDADNKEITWSSSNSSVVKVTEDGRIIAKTKGTAIITVTSKDDSNIKATLTVNALNPPLKTVPSIKENSKIISGSKVSEVNINIRISGGTERYSCDYVRIYKDDVVVKEGNCENFQNTINDYYYLNVYPAENGVYYADYKFHDSDGEISEGITNSITVTD